EAHEVADRLDLRHGDWFDPLAEGERFDLIVSNPPYIPRGEIAALDLEVSRHDPHMALDGGDDGLGPYRLFAVRSRAYLDASGAVLVEHGAGQGEAVRRLFLDAGAANVTNYHDLAGRDRVVCAKY